MLEGEACHVELGGKLIICFVCFFYENSDVGHGENISPCDSLHGKKNKGDK